MSLMISASCTNGQSQRSRSYGTVEQILNELLQNLNEYYQENSFNLKKLKPRCKQLTEVSEENWNELEYTFFLTQRIAQKQRIKSLIKQQTKAYWT